MITIDEASILLSEKKVLPKDKHFSNDAKSIIKCMDNCDVLACPGAGKTTMLISKIDILSGYMPFENNQGMCILSHTNVAVNEIKSKLSAKSTLILNYPNFVGTIQSFIHKFIVFPYLSTITDNPISVYDNNKYYDELYSAYQSMPLISLKTIVNRRAQTAQYNNNVKVLLSNLHLDIDTGNLLLGTSNIAGYDKKSCIEFRHLKETLWKRGIISYEDAYYLSYLALRTYPSLISSINKRFYITIIDEYQDCNRIQVDLLNQIFSNSNTIFQKIGDDNQAIYNNYKDEDNIWIHLDNVLKLLNTNRYHQLIANQISKLKKDGNLITSNVVENQIKPYVIVYSEETIKSVIPKFGSIIIENNLDLKEGAVFKGVGMIKKDGVGIKLGSYWDDYDRNTIQDKKILYLDDYINQLYSLKPDFYLQEVIKIINSLFLELFNLCNKTNCNGRKFNLKSLYKFLCENLEYGYKDFILEITKIISDDLINKSNVQIVKEKIKNKILSFEFIDEQLIHSFLESIPQNDDDKIVNSNKNIYCYVQGEKTIDIEIGTVHSVKGETHTATLYLETDYSNGSDLKRVCPLFKGENLVSGLIHEKSRKIVYVGMSRPQYLLCVAMKNDTFELYSDYINESEWNVIHL